MKYFEKYFFYFICFLAQTHAHTVALIDDKTVRHIFWNSNNSNDEEDFATVQNKLDELATEVKLQEANLNRCKKELERFEDQNIDLKCDIKQYKKDLYYKKKKIHNLKETVKQQHSDLKYYKRKIEDLKENEKNSKRYIYFLNILLVCKFILSIIY